jgi:DNA-binding MarR family transcriptional regulator/N-acetylglutamate synthase-like GNAT family acetyltransferase
VTDGDFSERVEAVRRFNRFYTKRIGVLHEGLVGSPFSLAEARVLYELASSGQTTATRLGRELGVDGGYLSRILRRFDRAGLIDRKRSESDGRQRPLRLTGPGREAFAALDSRSRDENGAMLGALADLDQRRLVAAMGTVEELLGATPKARAPYLIRPHQPGDLGWIVHRHGLLYAEEYGWDATFEALVARIAADFLDNLDPKAERCWIAEMDGEIAGCVLLVRRSKRVAKLRLLLVEPKARGLGIGARLVEECLRFARRAGYHKVTLWTNSVLTAARHIYENAGFTLVDEAPHHSFGQDLIGQTWTRDLQGPGPAPPQRG